MAKPTPIQLTTGDTQPWEFHLKDENGDPVNLTGATVTISMRARGATTNKIDGGSVTLTAATQGTITYNPSSGDTDTPGTFDLEIKVVDSSSDVNHNFELLLVEIREALNA